MGTSWDSLPAVYQNHHCYICEHNMVVIHTFLMVVSFPKEPTNPQNWEKEVGG